MNLEELFSRRKAMLDDVARALTDKAVDLSNLSRPVAVLEARKALVSGRIAELKHLRAEEAARIDAQISSLETELTQLDSAINEHKAIFDPDLIQR